MGSNLVNGFRFVSGTGELESQFDAASKGTNSSVSGTPLTKTVDCFHSSGARTDRARTTGRRCFGIKLISVTAPEAFFAGVSKVNGWNGSYDAGLHFLWYASTTSLMTYPSGSAVAMTGKPANPTVANDIMYYDFNIDAGTLAAKLNAGAWSNPAALPAYPAGESWAISGLAPSTSNTAHIVYTVLTTAAELGANIPAGAIPWDNF